MATEADDAITLIQAGATARKLESSTLEFKQEAAADPKRALEMVADAVVCLANAEGGAIVLGVVDGYAGQSAFVGVSGDLTVDVLRRGIFERTRPSLSVPIEERQVGLARLIIITVPKGVPFYSNSSGTATRRVGTECRPFPPEEQRQAAAARGATDWSAELSDVGFDAIDPEQLGRLRRLLVLAGWVELTRSDDRKMLRDLRLTSQHDLLTRAGLLLLGKDEAIALAVPDYGFAYQFRLSPGHESTARFRSGRPLLVAIEMLLEAVSARSQIHPLTASGGVQLPIRDYPEEAIRELVVNALVHRDYEAHGAVEVEHAPDSLTVTSPGGLVYGVTPENILTHPSTPRNRLLLETVTQLQVAERTGQGIDRAYRELLRTGKEPPVIADDGHQVRVVVPGGVGNDAFARFVAELDPALAGDVDVLLALSALRGDRIINANTLARLAQRSPLEAQTVLKRMADQRLVAPTKRTAQKPVPSYGLTGDAIAGLGRAVKYHVLGVDETDRKVGDHVREYGHVTNATLRRLFDLDVTGARDLLRALQAREVLTKLDAARGGPGIRYGPGPAFEKATAGIGRGNSKAPRQLTLESIGVSR